MTSVKELRRRISVLLEAIIINNSVMDSEPLEVACVGCDYTLTSYLSIMSDSKDEICKDNADAVVKYAALCMTSGASINDLYLR